MTKFNNKTIKNAIMDALDKLERGIEIDRNELINVILKHGDRDFGIKNKDTGKYYTEEELQYSIYIHINEIDENYKCYIGQTSLNPERRWRNNGTGYKGQVFYNAIKKHGWNNFSHVVLCYGLNKEEADNMEIKLISIFKTINEKFSYNIENGGNSVGKHSNETIRKISEAKKGKHLSEEHKKKIGEAMKGEKHHMYGKHFSEEHKKKIGEAKKGEKHPLYGKHHSEETRNKMKEARKGKYVGENSPMYGKHFSEEHKKKLSEAKKGKYTGENNPNAKKVYCDGMIFPTKKECAKFYNVPSSTMCTWLLGRRKIPYKFIELGLRYATEEDINTYPLYIEEQNQQN